MDEYYRAVRALPAWLAAPLAQLPAQTVVHIQELRLRTDCAVTFTVQGRQCPASALPGCPPALAAMRLDTLQIEEIFHTLCNGSVHTHERELAEGYLTTVAGNRVGVAGQFVQREGQCITLQKVTSLNLRIARSCYIHLPLELDKLLEQHFTGLLVVGEPGSGKTTLLRTIARTLAERQRLVAVVDERGELFPPEGPLPPLERMALLAAYRGSMRTVPVKKRGEPLMGVCCPQRMISWPGSRADTVEGAIQTAASRPPQRASRETKRRMT